MRVGWSRGWGWKIASSFSLTVSPYIQEAAARLATYHRIREGHDSQGRFIDLFLLEGGGERDCLCGEVTYTVRYGVCWDRVDAPEDAEDGGEDLEGVQLEMEEGGDPAELFVPRSGRLSLDLCAEEPVVQLVVDESVRDVGEA